MIATLLALFVVSNLAADIDARVDNWPDRLTVVIETTPTPVPPPTPTPRPTIPSPSTQVVRLSEKHDTRANNADRQYQSTADAFTEMDFTGHDAVGAIGNALTIPQCHIGQAGYPWLRYAIAWPATTPNPTSIVLDGLVNWSPEFILQQTKPTPTDPWEDTVLAIGGTDYNLSVTAHRHDCRLLEGHVWTLHN